MPQYFFDYFKFREVVYNLRNVELDPQFARINVGVCTVENIGCKCWNILPDPVKAKSKQQNFRKILATHFLKSYNDY